MAESVGIRDALKRFGVPLLGVALFSALFFLPLGYFYLRGIRAAPVGVGRAIAAMMTEPNTWRVAGFSAGQASVSALLCVLAGLPGAFAVSHLHFPLKRFIRSVSLVPFVLPSIIVIISIITFYGRSGFVNRLFGTNAAFVYGAGGIILAHVFYNVSLAVRIIGDGWSRIAGRYLEAARSLGDRSCGVFFRITLPLLAPHIAAAFVLIFMYCFFSFGIVLVFGGIRYATFEVRIYQELFVRLDLARASMYGVLQLMVSVGILWLAAAAGRLGVAAKSGAPVRTRGIGELAPPARVFIVAYGVLFLVFLFGPLAGIVVRSFGGSGSGSGTGIVSLNAYRALFDPDLSPVDVAGVVRSSIGAVIARSVGIAGAAGTLSFLLAVVLCLSRAVRERQILRRFFELPLGVSVVSFSIGLRLLFEGMVPPVLLVVIAQVFVSVPFVFRIVGTVLDDLNQRYVESARSLGASPLRSVRDIHWPILRPGLLNAYAYAVAIAFADFTGVLTVGRGEVVTFPVAIYRLIGFRSFNLAIALSVIYFLICLLLFIWIDRTSGRQPRGTEVPW